MKSTQSEFLECYEEYLRKLRNFFPKRHNKTENGFIKKEIARVETHIAKLRKV